MNYIFFGTPEFASIILEKLIHAEMAPNLVICNPDRPAGRKKIITPPPVKAKIMNYQARISAKGGSPPETDGPRAHASGGKDKIKILQPEKLDKNFRDSLFMIRDSFDFFLVAAYAKILPKEIIGLPRLHTIGVHPSLLPKHRGATPIQSAILNGDKKTGTTIYQLDDKMDHGPIIAKSEIRISKPETYESLHNKLAKLSAELLIEILPKFVRGEIIPKPQNHAQATYTKKFALEDAFIAYEDLEIAQKEGGKIAEKADRKIKALNPNPGTWTINPPADGGKRIKLLESKLENGKLRLTVIQKEGKTPIKVG